MDLQGKYQILASEFSKVRGQVTVLKKAVIDEQTKTQELRDEINQKDQNLRRNTQEIETLSFLNTQLKSRLEILQQELNETENNAKLKKTNANRIQQKREPDDVLAQELEQKIKQYETVHRRVYDLEKQLVEGENERIASRATIEQLQSQMANMQEAHQRARDEHERILKQLKQENELINEQFKQHLTEQPTVVISRKPSVLAPSTITATTTTTKVFVDPSPQAEIFLHKYMNAWRDAFTELTIYVEERLKNNNCTRSPDMNQKMAHAAKAFQQHSDNFLAALKTRLFDGKFSHEDTSTTNFAELFSMFISSCEKVLAFAVKSVCDEPKLSSENQQEHVHARITTLNITLSDLLQRWMNNLSHLREIAVAIIQFDSSLPSTIDTRQAKIAELLAAFQTGSIIHCDLDKHYNDKLCLEYELTISPVHLTTTDECILAALRKLATLDQQIAQLIRDNQMYLFEPPIRSVQQEGIVEDPSEDSHQQLVDAHNKTILYNAETIGALEQVKEHWRLEYQLLKIKCEKMRDDHIKQMDELREKVNRATPTTNGTPVDDFDSIVPPSSPTISPTTTDQRERRTTSDPPTEREIMIKQYYSQKILDLETKLQLANGKAIAFYNELANIHQRLKNSKDQEARSQHDIEQMQQDLTKMMDELATTTKGYEEQIATMSEHLASMNEQVTSQNDKIDQLQRQMSSGSSKDGKKGKK